VSLVEQTYLQLGVAPRYDGVTFFIFFSTFFIYSFHRWLGVHRVSPEDRQIITRWASEHENTLVILVLVSFIGMGISIFFIPFKMIVLLALLGIISVLYELPLIQHNKIFKRLRNIGLLKVFMIVFVVAAVSVIVPVINVGYNFFTTENLLIYLGRSLFILNLGLCFDARDMYYDVKEKIKTVPIAIGISKTRRLYMILCVIIIAVYTLNFLVLNNDLGIFTGLVLSNLVATFIIYNTVPRRSDYYYIFLVDGMMFLQFFFVWIGIKVF
jgi:4-hydroxybenzoate polyprenyltransferase